MSLLCFCNSSGKPKRPVLPIGGVWVTGGGGHGGVTGGGGHGGDTVFSSTNFDPKESDYALTITLQNGHGTCLESLQVH